MDVNELEIICLYRANSGREVPFNSLFNNSDVIDEDNLGDFWNVMGGLIININQFCTIVRENNYYVLLNPVTFLLHSLYWLKGLDSNWYDEDEEHPGCLTIKTMDGKILILKQVDELTLSLSYYYQNKSELNSERGNTFFSDLRFGKDIWKSATIKSLEEYFSVYKTLLEWSKSDIPSNSNMLEFLRLWDNII